MKKLTYKEICNLAADRLWENGRILSENSSYDEEIYAAEEMWEQSKQLRLDAKNDPFELLNQAKQLIFDAKAKTLEMENPQSPVYASHFRMEAQAFLIQLKKLEDERRL